jgi:hypothetical protein
LATEENSGTGDTGARRALAHGELVAKPAGCGLTHAGQAQVLARECGRFEIEFVERNDPRERDVAHQVGNVR